MKIDHFFRDANNSVVAVDAVGTQLLLDPISIVLLKPQIGDFIAPDGKGGFAFTGPEVVDVTPVIVQDGSVDLVTPPEVPVF